MILEFEMDTYDENIDAVITPKREQNFNIFGDIIATLLAIIFVLLIIVCLFLGFKSLLNIVF